MRIVPDRKMPSARRVATFDQIPVRKQDGHLGFVGLNARGVDSHDVGPVGKVGDAAKTFGFALRTIGTARAIKTGELSVCGRVDGCLDFKRKRPVWRLWDGETVGRYDKTAVRYRSPVELAGNKGQAVGVEHQRGCRTRRIRS